MKLSSHAQKDHQKGLKVPHHGKASYLVNAVTVSISLDT